MCTVIIDWTADFENRKIHGQSNQDVRKKKITQGQEITRVQSKEIRIN